MASESCLDDDALYVVAEGDEPSPSAAAHLAQCESCRDRLKRQRASITTIRQLFQHRSDSDIEKTDRTELPRFLGRYFVAGRLYEDEDFVVYRGVHSLLQADVFIYHSKQAIGGDDESGETLLAECRRLGNVRNETIARVLDVEMVGKTPSLVIEFAAGQPLEDAAGRDDFDSACAARLVANVAVALADLHKNGMVHGGLSKSSIVVTGDGRPKIIDLGTSQVRQLLRETKSPAQARPGTATSPAATAPASAAQSPAADVVALGEILDWLLTTDRLQSRTATDIRMKKLRHAAQRATSQGPDAIQDMRAFASAVRQTLDSSMIVWLVAIGILIALGIAIGIWFNR